MSYGSHSFDRSLVAGHMRPCVLQANQAELKKQMDAMRAELGTALNSQLSPAELADLSRLGPELDRMQASTLNPD